MRELVKFAVIIVALGIQLAAVRAPNRWYIWGLYAVAALATARLYAPDTADTARARAREKDTARPAPPALHLVRLLMVLIAVGSTALASEWSATERMPAATLAAWVSTLAALSAAVWGLRVGPQRRRIDIATRNERLALLALLLIALLLRTLWLAELPRVYFGDESRAGMWVRNAYQSGMPNLLTMGWNTWSMVGLSLQGLFAPWLGLNTVSVRLASALFGTVAVLTTYLLTRDLFDRRTALLAASLLAFNRTAIDFSRLGTTHAQVMGFETLAFFALWRAVNGGSALAYAWTGILAALCLHTYNAAHVVPLLLLGWLLLTTVTRPRDLRSYAAGAAIAIGAFILVSLPWFHYLSDHYQFGNNWLQFTWMARARQVTPRLVAAFYDGGMSAAWPLLARQAWKTWLGFTVLPAEAYQLGYRGGGMLDHVSAALFVLGLGLALRARGRGAFVLYWWGATAVTGGVLTIDPPAFVRLVGIIPAVCILAALPLRSLLASATRSAWLGAAGAALLVGAAWADNWRTYFIDYAQSSGDDTSELVHFVRGVPATSPVYLLGADSFLHFSHDVNVEQFAFDFPTRTLEDIAEPGRFLPIRDPQLEVPTYLVLGPTQLGIDRYVHQLYPHTEAVDVTHRGNGRLFFRYLRLTPEDLARQAEAPVVHGLTATYERDQQVVLERLDPQLNFFTVETYFLRPRRLSIQAPFRARWRGALRIEAAGSYGFEVAGSGPFRVDFGSERVCELDAVVPEEPQTCRFERQLESGTVPIAVRWDALPTEGSVRMMLQMYWTPPGAGRELVPPDRFVPAEGGG